MTDIVRRIGVCFLLALAPVIAASSPATAQVIIPGGAEAGRSAEPILRRPLTALSDTSAAATTADSEVEAPETGVSFVLNGIEVTDSTVFSSDDFRALYGEYVGTNIEVGTIFAIAAKATALYRSKGYILSQVIVPPQEIDGGVVRLQAVEGFVDSVVIDGDIGSERGLVAQYGDGIKASRPLRADVLERYLLLTGDLAGLKIEGVFAPSKTTAGASTLTIKSSYDRFEGSVAVVSTGSHEVGPVLGSAELTLNSVMGLHERIILKAGVASQPDELQVGEIQITAPIGPNGTSAFGRFSVSNSDPGNGLETFGINSKGPRLSVGVKHAVIRSRSKNLFVGVQFDVDDLTSTSATLGTLSDDHVRVIRFGGDFDFVDTALGDRMPALSTMRATLSQGVDVFGATTAASANKSRTNASGIFTSVFAEIQRYQQLGHSGFSLLLAAQGQYANKPLLASEEFGFGGAEYGRGYDPSSIVGDRGIAGKIELQYKRHLDMGLFDNPDFNVLEDYQPYAFLDGGIVENLNADGLGNSARRNLWSTGAGVRLGFANNIDVDVTLAYRGDASNSVRTFGDRLRALVKAEAHF